MHFLLIKLLFPLCCTKITNLDLKPIVMFINGLSFFQWTCTKLFSILPYDNSTFSFRSRSEVKPLQPSSICNKSSSFSVHIDLCPLDKFDLEQVRPPDGKSFFVANASSSTFFMEVAVEVVSF